VDLYSEGCAVHRHRDDVVLVRHHVWPLGKSGPDEAANIVLICPNGHYDVHEYMRALEFSAENGNFPRIHVDKRNYGRKTRFLAEKGFFSYYRA
jgi:hypothetical protein